VTTAKARRDLIVRMIQERDSLSVSELMAQFQVTDTSIRHDLNLLEEQGKLRRVHGGAVSRPTAQVNGLFARRARENPAQKRRIGLAAAGLVQAGNVVFFDSGSTVVEVAAHLPGTLRASRSITMVTHSLPVIQEVGSWEQSHLICLGGLYLPDYQAMVGPVTLADLRELSADIAFLGCDGLTVDGGLSTPHMLIAEVGAAMAARARRVVVVADSTKPGRAGFTPIVGLDAVTVLVTDRDGHPDQLAQIRDLGIEVVLA
jgi:DeoR/GlpR family transcriptional regulator of sugar metabolism